MMGGTGRLTQAMASTIAYDGVGGGRVGGVGGIAPMHKKRERSTLISTTGCESSVVSSAFLFLSCVGYSSVGPLQLAGCASSLLSFLRFMEATGSSTAQRWWRDGAARLRRRQGKCTCIPYPSLLEKRHTVQYPRWGKRREYTLKRQKERLHSCEKQEGALLHQPKSEPYSARSPLAGSRVEFRRRRARTSAGRYRRRPPTPASSSQRTRAAPVHPGGGTPRTWRRSHPLW